MKIKYDESENMQEKWLQKCEIESRQICKINNFCFLT